MSDQYAVMGSPVSHSLSPRIHHLFAQQTGQDLYYGKIEINEDLFEQQLRDFFDAGGKGLNITLPCKQRAFSLVDDATARCKLAQAANTLWLHQGRLQGDNTDGVGLLRDLSGHCQLAGKNILLLGAGGAARGVIGPLLAANPASLTIANRTLQKAIMLQQQFPLALVGDFAALSGIYDLVINATSASLGKGVSELPAMLLANQPFCYDLMYQLHGNTSFVNWAQQHGCQAIDGLGMLVEQAAEAFFIWRGVRPDIAATLANLRSG